VSLSRYAPHLSLLQGYHKEHPFSCFQSIWINRSHPLRTHCRVQVNKGIRSSNMKDIVKHSYLGISTETMNDVM
jgi:hypothetical protein